MAFSDDLHWFEGLSGREDFFEIWEGKHFSVVSIFDDEDVRDAFQRTDFKLMRTAAFSNRKLWDILMERTTPRFDREGAERYVCELSGDQGRCGMVFTSWKKYMAHQTHKIGNHGIKSPLRVAVITNQCVNCGSTFADRPTAQNHVVNSWTSGTCRTDRSHMTWALEEIVLPISCNLCAQEFGDLQTYYTHAFLTHLPFPAPTIRESRHAQPARQPRRHRLHSRDGHEREPGIHQEGRQQRRRGAAKAAPTNRQQSQARRRGPRIDGSSSQAKEEFKFDQKSLNKLMLKAILKMHQTTRELTSTVWYTLLVNASSPEADNMQKQTQTYAKKVQQEERGHTRGPPFVSAYLGLVKSLQQRGTTVGARTGQGIASYWAGLEPFSLKH